MSRKGINPGKGKPFRMSDEHRTKIQNSQILNRLINHALGKCEMSQTQVQAGLGLMRKVLPDLSNVNHTGEIEHVIGRKPLSMEEWAEKHGADLEPAAGSAARLN